MGSDAAERGVRLGLALVLFLFLGSFSFGFSAYYDYVKGAMDYYQTEATYNTDCCGLSVQYGRFSLGLRDESQFHVSFAISNIGSFGTLQRQQRIF